MRIFRLLIFVALLLPAVALAQYSLLDSGGAVVGVCTTQDGAKVKCVKFNPRATPVRTPQATPSPSPTKQPLPCEVVTFPSGSSWTVDVEKTYNIDGSERMLCFDVPASGGAFINISSLNHGNASCAQMEAQLESPMGETYYSIGSQPGAVIARTSENTPGRWYFWTRLLWAKPGPCQTYTFTILR